MSMYTDEQFDRLEKMKIERDGVRYDEAIDPAEMGRMYVETDEPVDELED